MKLEASIDGKPFGSHNDKGRMTYLDDDEEELLQKVIDNGDRGALHGRMTRLRQVWTIGAIVDYTYDLRELKRAL